MEGENKLLCDYNRSVFSDERGEYRIISTKSLEFMERDCGDHLQLTITFMASPNNTLFLLQQGSQREAEVLKYTKPMLSIPPIVLKIPKHLPQDISQRNKVLTRIGREAQLKAVYDIFQAQNQTGVSSEEIMSFLQGLISPEEEEEVKNMCDAMISTNCSD